MDFRYLVEKGPYKGAEEGLPESERAALSGYDFAVEQVRTYADNWDGGGSPYGQVAVEGSGTLARIAREVSRATVGDLLEWLATARCELVVDMADNCGGRGDAE